MLPFLLQFRLDYALSREQQNKSGGKMYIQDKVQNSSSEQDIWTVCQRFQLRVDVAYMNAFKLFSTPKKGKQG